MSQSIFCQCTNPGCSTSYAITPDDVGRLARCKRCGNEFTIQDVFNEPPPQSDDPEAELPPPDDGFPLAVDHADVHPVKISRFEVVGFLDKGAFGRVYRAFDPILEREIALKVPHARVVDNPERRELFLSEPKASARLRHPNIVPVFDAGVDGDSYYIASALIDGRTLESVIRGDRPDFQRSAELVASLADALHYAHREGIIHRDVKPANVMLDRDGQALLMDFGLARMEYSILKRKDDRQIAGTPAYMSPEQATGRVHEVTPASDQYSLGVVLYELLSGEPPFTGPSHVVLASQIKREFPPLSQRVPEIPADLEAICAKATAKKPSDRYSDCAAFAEDLRSWLKGMETSARVWPPLERARHWSQKNRLAAALAATVAVLLIGSFVSITSAWLNAVGEQRNAEGQREIAEGEKDKADALRKSAEASRRRAEAARRTAEGLQDRLSRDLYAKNVLLADDAWRNNQVQQANELLLACQESLRDWEWRHVKGKCRLPIPFASQHAQKITSVAHSPDGHWVATGSYDKEVKVWDAGTQRFHHNLGTLGPDGWTVTSVAFSRDGQRLAAADLNGNVRVWKTRGWVLEHAVRARIPVWSLAFGRDSQLCLGCLGNAVMSYDLSESKPIPDGRFLLPPITTDAELAKLTKEPDKLVPALLQKVSFGPVHIATTKDGEWLVSAGFDGQVRRFNLRTVLLAGEKPVSNQPILLQPGHMATKTVYMSVAISPDGRQIAAGTADGIIHRWTASQAAQRTHLASTSVKAHSDAVLALAYTADGHRLASAGFDRTIRIWDRGNNQSTVLRGSSSAIWALSFGRRGRWIAAGNEGHELTFWDSTSYKTTITEPAREQTDSHSDSAVSADCRVLAWIGGGDSREIRILHTSDPDRRVQRIAARLLGEPTRLLAVDSKGQRIAVFLPGNGDKRAASAAVYHVSEQKTVALKGAALDDASRAIFNREASRLAVVAGRRCLLFDARSGTKLCALDGHTQIIHGVAFSPDGRWIASAGADGTVRLWDAAGKPQGPSLFQSPNRKRVFGVAFSPDGELLAAAHEDGIVRILHRKSGRWTECKGHTLPVNAIAFAPGSKSNRLASAGEDGTVRLWNPQTGAQVFVLRSASIETSERGSAVSNYRFVGFSSDGTELTAVATDGTAHVWKAP